MNNDFGVTTNASKKKPRKTRYIKGYSSWMGIHKDTQKMANRSARHNGGVDLGARAIKRVDPDQGRQEVAGNRCGNVCGRRAVMGDYLCLRCRE